MIVKSNKRGSMLVITIMIIGILTFCLGSFLSYSSYNSKITAKSNNRLRAYHMALTGIQTSIYRLEQNWDNKATIEPEYLIADGTGESDSKLYFFTEDTKTTVNASEYIAVTSYGYASGEIIKLHVDIGLEAKGPPPESFAIINYFKYRDRFEDVGYDDLEDDPDEGLIGEGNGVFDFTDGGFQYENDNGDTSTYGTNNKYLDWLDDGYQGLDNNDDPVFNNTNANNGVFDEGERGESHEPFSIHTNQKLRLVQKNENDFIAADGQINGGTAYIKSFKYEEPIFSVLDDWVIFGSIYSNSTIAFDTDRTEDNVDACKILGPEDYVEDVLNDGFYTMYEPYTDENMDGSFNVGEPFEDIIINDKWDDAESYTPTTAGVDDPSDGPLFFHNGIYDYGFIIQDNGWVFNKDFENMDDHPDGADPSLNQVLDSEDEATRAVALETKSRLQLESGNNSLYKRTYMDGFWNNYTGRYQYTRNYNGGSETKDVSVEIASEMFNVPYLEAPDLDKMFPFYQKYDDDDEAMFDNDNNQIYDEVPALREQQYDVYIGKDYVAYLSNPDDPENCTITTHNWRDVKGQPGTGSSPVYRANVDDEWKYSTYTNASSESKNLSQSDQEMQYMMEVRRKNPFLPFAYGATSNLDITDPTKKFYRSTFTLDDATGFYILDKNVILTLGHVNNDASKRSIGNANNANTINYNPFAYNKYNHNEMANSSPNRIRVKDITLDGAGSSKKFWIGEGIHMADDFRMRRIKNNGLSNSIVDNSNYVKLPSANTFSNIQSGNGRDLTIDIWIHPFLNNKIIYIDGNMLIGTSRALNYRIHTGEPYYDVNYNGIRDYGFEEDGTRQKDDDGNNVEPEFFLDMNNNGVWDNGVDGNEPENLNIIFVMRGNLTIGDDFYYAATQVREHHKNIGSSKDCVTFIALSHPDDDVFLDRDPDADNDQVYHKDDDLLIKDVEPEGFHMRYGTEWNRSSHTSNYKGAAEGSGNIYLGHPSLGTTFFVHGRFYADNFFYANDKYSASGDYPYLYLYGCLMGGGAVVFNNGSDTKQLIIHHDGRYWPFQDRLSLGSKFPDPGNWTISPGRFKRLAVSKNDQVKVTNKINSL